MYLDGNIANCATYLVDNTEDLFKEEEALPVLTPRSTHLHRDVGSALHLETVHDEI